LDHIPFKMDPDISALPLEKIASLSGIDKLPLSGPMSLKGRLRGHTVSSKELLASLDGDLNAEIGPGALNKIGKVGDLFAKILSMTSIQSIFSGRMIENLSGEGIPFQSIKTQTSFAKGTLNLNNLDFESKAINVNSQGTIDLINQELNIETKLVPFETVKKAFNIIPIPEVDWDRSPAPPDTGTLTDQMWSIPVDRIRSTPSRLISFIPFAPGSGQQRVPAMAMAGNLP